MLDAPPQFTIRRPMDAHVHFRDEPMLADVVPYTADHFAYGVVMPNVPAIETAEQAQDYRRKIMAAAGGRDFTPLMTLKLTQRTTPAMIEAAQWVAKAAKLYPSGATTASHDGISEPLSPQMLAVYEAMQRCGLILCIHGEDPAAEILDRESSYLKVVREIVRRFPGLKVVLEHITTEEAVRYVEEEASVNVAATITLHHLMLSLTDVLGSGIKPHLFCYPVAKRIRDRDALLDAAIFSQTGRFFFGSDSAPHLRGAKESACGCAGIFSAPVALAGLVQVFGDVLFHKFRLTPRYRRESPRPDHFHWGFVEDQLEPFVSINGPTFYGLTVPERTTRLDFQHWPWIVPTEIAGVVPFLAGEKCWWRVADEPLER